MIRMKLHKKILNCEKPKIWFFRNLKT